MICTKCEGCMEVTEGTYDRIECGLGWNILWYEGQRVGFQCRECGTEYYYQEAV